MTFSGDIPELALSYEGRSESALPVDVAALIVTEHHQMMAATHVRLLHFLGLDGIVQNSSKHTWSKGS